MQWASGHVVPEAGKCGKVHCCFFLTSSSSYPLSLHMGFLCLLPLEKALLVFLCWLWLDPDSLHHQLPTTLIPLKLEFRDLVVILCWWESPLHKFLASILLDQSWGGDQGSCAAVGLQYKHRQSIYLKPCIPHGHRIWEKSLTVVTNSDL